MILSLFGLQRTSYLINYKKFSDDGDFLITNSSFRLSLVHRTTTRNYHHHSLFPPSLVALRHPTTEQKWFLFVDENQNTIYRDAAYLGGYMPNPATLLEGIGPREDGMERQTLYSRRATAGMEGWKDFCAYQNYCLPIVRMTLM